ncbi:hypothetical protein J2S21_002271 [Peribacillus cavernae]|nr:hypothetical protein [Peribacillus cavernae]
MNFAYCIDNQGLLFGISKANSEAGKNETATKPKKISYHFYRSQKTETPVGAPVFVIEVLSASGPVLIVHFCFCQLKS